jgi:hypothetical protein
MVKPSIARGCLSFRIEVKRSSSHEKPVTKRLEIKMKRARNHRETAVVSKRDTPLTDESPSQRVVTK